jgi:hypothetical protein
MNRTSIYNCEKCNKEFSVPGYLRPVVIQCDECQEQDNEKMSDKNTGGPAFPMPSGMEPKVDITTHYNEGMTLLDYFAGQALPAVITYMKFYDCGQSGIAKTAYDQAQAMLAERKRRGL